MESKNQKETLFVSHKEMPAGQPPHITKIEADAAPIVEQFSKAQGLNVAKIHNMSPKPDEPDITIVVITQERLPQAKVQTVQQEVINWLMQMGYIPFRE